MPRLYDTKNRAWVTISRLRRFLYRYSPSKRYVCAVMGNGYDFTGANVIKISEYQKDAPTKD